METQKIISLLQREEGPKLDFKLKLGLEIESGKKELAKDICAIANSRGGRGYLLIGIEDKTKRIIGIDPLEFKEEKIQQIVSTRIDPPVPISADIVSMKEKYIGVITIYNTEQKPHQVRDSGAFYIRRGSTTDIMRKEEIASMLQDIGIVNYELLPIIKASLKDLDNQLISDYFSKSGINLNINDTMLLSSGIVTIDKDDGKSYPTCGSILLFGKNPQNFIPHSVIKIYNSSTRHMHISTGTIIEMLEDSFNFINNSLQDKSFPIEIVFDLISKASTHRDYFDINSFIEVNLRKETIEIITPGASLKNQRHNNVYIRRNHWLYLKLITIDSEKKYFNLPIDISNFIKTYGKIKYYNIPSKNIFKVIIPLVKRDV